MNTQKKQQHDINRRKKQHEFNENRPTWGTQIDTMGFASL